MTVSKPLLIFDGRCGFCRIWIEYWKQLTGDRVAYAPSQEVGGQYPQIPGDAFRESVQLVRPDGTVANGARAVFETLGKERIYESVPSLAPITEAAYRAIAAHRDLFYRLTKFTFGTRIEPTRFTATQWLFKRALAVIYSIAFISISIQSAALLGAHGVLPISNYLGLVAQRFGIERYFLIPSIFWWGSDDVTVTGLAIAGGVLAGLFFITGFRKGVFERLILISMFALYLSYSTTGQEFFAYQWDALLLETGFLAIFLGGSRIIPWLFRWLIFRFYFLSGAVKLLSGDPTWRNLTALSYHYHTQPLPTIAAWYLNLAPMWFHRASTFLVLGIELGAPFLIFMPRRMRMFGAWCMIGLQVLIMITGNYAFFNWLTIALCLFLFDDQALARFVPKGIRKKLGILEPEAVQEPRLNALPQAPRLNAPPQGLRIDRETALASLIAVVVVTLGLTIFAEDFRLRPPAFLSAIAERIAPFEIVNSYGLFAVMTTTRPEVIIEGSADGERWLPYGFPYKPGDLNRAPAYIAPYQPRFDWQLWFAALSDFRSNPWLVNFVVRLLNADKPVESLVSQNPFPDRPPRFIRATLYEYNFTDWATHRRTGEWWARVVKGAYLPPVGLRSAAETPEPGSGAPPQTPPATPASPGQSQETPAVAPATPIPASPQGH